MNRAQQPNKKVNQNAVKANCVGSFALKINAITHQSTV